MRIHLWKAYAHLYPNADPLRDYELRDDGNGPYLAYFNPALGNPPTTAEEDAAILAYDAAKAAKDAADATLRANVLSVAQSAVGVRFDQLTAVQVRALAAVLFWKAGALNSDGTVKPLNAWVV